MSYPKTHLKIRIDPEYKDILQPYYQTAINLYNQRIANNERHLDSGFDLFIPKQFSNLGYNESRPITVDHQVSCALYDEQGTPLPYYLYPRSSISKTPFRLANSTGIIDSGYRGHLIAKIDCITGEAYDHGEDAEEPEGIGMSYVDTGVTNEDTQEQQAQQSAGFNVSSNMFIRTINANRVGRYSNFYEGTVGSRMFQVCAYNLLPFTTVELVDDLDETTRGTGGFGSTG